MSIALSELHRVALAHVEPVVELTKQICVIPAPTGNERRRAEFVAALLRKRGYTPEIDEIGNVYVRRGKQARGPVLMLLAHTDTVFPEGTPLNVVREGDALRGPGIGDNCLSVASMLHILDMLDEVQYETDVDIVVVANVGEEGLGNLRGARAAVERYRSSLGAVIAIDGRFGHIVNAAVGSLRWRINVAGPGGHSFGSFGTPSAIHGLARIITAISALQVPRDPKTTFNVGTIEGGTSVNTIASSASALLDMRSLDVGSLNRLAEQVREIIAHGAGTGLRTTIEVLGERPAGTIAKDAPLVQIAAECLRWLGFAPKYTASSTDANIPLSLHIPAVCIGITNVERTHTIEEWLSIAPIGNGLAQLLRLCIDACAMLAQTRK